MTRAGRRSVWWCVCIGLLLGSGCSSGGGSGDPDTDLRILAQLFKGKISFGNLAAYEFSDNGVKGRMVGEGQADADGNIALDLSGVGTRYVLLAGFGGSLDDPFAGSSVSIPAIHPLCAIVDTTGDLSMRYQLNPMTTWVAKRTEELARQPDVDVGAAWRNADLGLRYRFGIDSPIGETPARDVLQTQSIIDGGTTIGLFDAIICEYAASMSRNPFEVVDLLGADARDGEFDGAYFGTALRWDLGGELGADIWSVGLAAAYTNYLASGFNVNGYTADDFELDEDLADSTGLPRAPAYLRTWPRYLTAGETSTFDVWGQNLPGLGKLEVRIGDFLVDSGDIADNGDGGYRLTLGADYTDQLQLSVGLRYDLHVADADSGVSTTQRAALGAVRNDEAPQIDTSRLDRPYVDSFGGGAYHLYGHNFKETSRFYIGSTEADVAELSPPNSATLVVPPLSAGMYDVRVEDGGGSSTAPDAVTAMVKGAATAEAGEDLRPEIGIGARYSFGDDTVTLFDFTANYSNAGNGTYQYNETKASAGNPTIRFDSHSGNLFSDDRDLEKDILLDSASLNLFHRANYNGNIGAALGPNTTLGYIKQPTSDVTEGDVEGTYNTLIQMWNFSTNEWRQMVGTFVLDDEGNGTLNVKCRGMTLAGGDDTFQPLGVSFEYQLGSLGKFTIESTTPGFDLQLSGQTDEDATLHYFYGTQGSDWLVWGLGGRPTSPEESDPVALSGAYVGPKATLRTDSGSAVAVYGRINMSLAFDDDKLSGITVEEGSEADDLAPDGRFQLDLRTPVKGVTGDGWTLSRKGDPRGFFISGGKALISFPRVGTGSRLHIRMPEVQTGASLAGTYYRGLSGYLDPDSDTDTVEQWSSIGRVRYDSPSLAGVKFGASYVDLGNETKHTRRLDGGTTQFANLTDETFGLSVEVVGVYDRLYKYVTDVSGSTGPYAGYDTPFLLAVGRKSGDTTYWTNNGTPGLQFTEVESRVPDMVPTSMPNASFRFGNIGSEFAGGNFSVSASKLRVDYSGGNATTTGRKRTQLQSTTYSNSTVNTTGQVTGFDSDGFFTETDTAGNTWRGFFLDEGRGIYRLQVGADLMQTFGVGVRTTGAAPKVCDLSGFRIITGFDSPNAPFYTILPLTSMNTVPNAMRGTGSFFYQAAGADHPVPFSYFSDQVNDIGSTGGFQYQDNSGTYFGGLSDGGGTGVVSPGAENADLTAIALQIQYRF